MTFHEATLYKLVGELENNLTYAISAIAKNANSGGFGSGFLTAGDGPPSTPPLNPAAENMYKNNLTGTLYTWNITLQVWE